MSFRSHALLMAAALSLGACASMKPSLNYKTMNLQNVDFEGATLDLVYALKNPNPLGGTLSHVKYSLAVEGKPIFSGDPSKGITVPAAGTADVHLPVRVKFADILPAASTIFSKNSAKYTAKGEVGFKTPFGAVALPFSKTAAFQLPKIPSFTMDTPTITNLSLTGAKLSIPLKISNGNAFALLASGLTGNVSIGGHKVGTATALLPTSLAANGTTTAQLPIEIDFLKVGSSVAGLLQGGSAQVKLDGSFTSGETSVPVNLNQLLSFVTK